MEEAKSANIGVQIGTTSLDAVNEEIEPDNDPKVFDTSNDVVTALKQGTVDAVVVDVPTAFFLTADADSGGEGRRPVLRTGRRPVGRPAARRTPR